MLEGPGSGPFFMESHPLRRGSVQTPFMSGLLLLRHGSGDRIAARGLAQSCSHARACLVLGRGSRRIGRVAPFALARGSAALCGRFAHTDYVNPAAPKGGRIRLGALGTFDNLNPLVSGVKGKLASHLMLIYEPLLTPALDEPTTEYGLLAEAVAHPDDFSSVSFRLRPEARWQDGQPVTSADVAFSFAPGSSCPRSGASSCRASQASTSCRTERSASDSTKRATPPCRSMSGK